MAMEKNWSVVEKPQYHIVDKSVDKMWISFRFAYGMCRENQYAIYRMWWVSDVHYSACVAGCVADHRMRMVLI